jgi:hypothetical protein
MSSERNICSPVLDWWFPRAMRACLRRQRNRIGRTLAEPERANWTDRQPLIPSQFDGTPVPEEWVSHAMQLRTRS